MPVHFIHAPYMKESRGTLLALQQQGADIVYIERWAASDDTRYDFSQEGVEPYISFLPTALLVDDDHKTVLTRAEQLEHITVDNIAWMHQQHTTWKAAGKKTPFPTPPWKNLTYSIPTISGGK